MAARSNVTAPIEVYRHGAKSQYFGDCFCRNHQGIIWLVLTRGTALLILHASYLFNDAVLPAVVV
jgi:hypothetical protein